MSDPQSALVDSLERLDARDDLGAFAALRRGLRGDPADDPHAHRYVLPFIGDARGHQERVAYWIAALYASHRGSGEASLAQALAIVRDKTKSESVERRFVALLEADSEDLLPHLRHAVALVKANEIRLNWRSLHRDLRQWNDPTRRAQRSWSRDFWLTTLAGEPGEPTSPVVSTPTPTGDPS